MHCGRRFRWLTKQVEGVLAPSGFPRTSILDLLVSVSGPRQALNRPPYITPSLVQLSSVNTLSVSQLVSQLQKSLTAMASDPRPTVLTEPSSSPAHGGSVFNPVTADRSSTSSLSSATAHPTPTPSPLPEFERSSEAGDEVPPPKGVKARVSRVLKWVVGYDDAAPGTIGSSDYLHELTHNPWQQVRLDRASRALHRPMIDLLRRSCNPAAQGLPHFGEFVSNMRRPIEAASNLHLRRAPQQLTRWPHS